MAPKKDSTSLPGYDFATDTVNGVPMEMIEDYGGAIQNLPYDQFNSLMSTMADDQRRKFEDLWLQMQMAERKVELEQLATLQRNALMGGRPPWANQTGVGTAPFPVSNPYFQGQQANPFLQPTLSMAGPPRVPAHVAMPAGSLIKCHSGHPVGNLVREAMLGALKADDIDWVEDSTLGNGSHFCPICHSTVFMLDNEHFRRQLLDSLLERLRAAGVAEAEEIIREFR